MLSLIVFELVLHLILFPAVVLFAPGVEDLPRPITFSLLQKVCARIFCWCSITAIGVYRWIDSRRLKATKRAWQQLEAILLTYACRFSEKPYISEILMTIAVSIVCTMYRRFGVGATTGLTDQRRCHLCF